MRTLAITLIALLFAGCMPAQTVRGDNAVQDAVGPKDLPLGDGTVVTSVQTGAASWYGPGFSGRNTANGETFNPKQLTAAHRSLPFNTLVRVTNRENQQSVVVRINDRGPFIHGRIIDLSHAAAEAIGMLGSGVANVTLEVLDVASGSLRLAAEPTLEGYDAVSSTYPVGTLIQLRNVAGEEAVIVRVATNEMPPSVGADLLVTNAVFNLIGAEAHYQTN